MPKDEINRNRGKDGKFLPGNRPPRSPGRPPGPNGVKARAARLAGDCLEQLLGKAVDVIDAALDDGDSHVATWLIDRVRPPGRSDYVRLAKVPKLATVEDIISASEDAVCATGRGELSLQDAKAFQEFLLRHAELKKLEEIAVLRAEVEQLLTTSRNRAPLQNDYLPTWGRLREV